MKVGAVIPTRGDRPQFLENALRQIGPQLELIEVVDDPPADQKKDITKRYRMGCERLLAKGVELIFFIEDDDYYSPDYVQRMVAEWKMSGSPDIFGINETVYYHLGSRKWNLQKHPGRASMFCTVVTAPALRTFRWPKDDNPFTDIEIWKGIKGTTIPLSTVPFAIGIKGHREGSLFGGIGHYSDRMRYDRDDAGMAWLRSVVDKESMEFYEKISESVR